MKDQKIRVTEIFEKNLNASTRFVFNQGGTRSSKTYSLMQLAHHLAACKVDNKIISVVSETMPHLKRGAMRDFFTFLNTYELYDPKAHNKSDNIYRIGSNQIEFFSADSQDKVHGPGRDYLFFNEIQNISYETFFHLAQRTNIQIFADYNPTYNFWVYPNFLNEPQYKDDITYIHSTIFDNPFVSHAIKKDVLIRAGKDSNYRKVYLEGEPGTLEGLVFESFNIVSELPEGLNFVYGLDFGYSNDPTALIKIAIQGENIYIDELIYRTGLTNSDILALFRDLKLKSSYDEIIADSAEPKSIEDILRGGYNVKPSVKGQDSVRQGIDVIKQFNICVTQRSTNIIKELRNYAWILDKNDNPTNKPSDIFNHAMDALRYGVQAIAKPVLTDYFL